MELEKLIKKEITPRAAYYFSLMLQGLTTFETEAIPQLEAYTHTSINEVSSIPLAFLGIYSWTQGFDNLNWNEKNSVTTNLSTTGIYGTIRNPIYSGARLMSLAMVLYNPSAENLVLSGIVYWATEVASMREERRLSYEFGDVFNQYKERVPGWIPYANQVGNVFRSLKNLPTTMLAKIR